MGSTRCVSISETRSEMGAAAAEAILGELRARLAVQDTVRMIFAAAPSQSEMLEGLVAGSDISWERVEAFHMDEYLGLPPEAPERFGEWLKRSLFERVPFGAVHLIDPGPDVEASTSEYARMLASAPIDIVCCGIGVNGHLAFNDPPVADFSDPEDVKVVELDEVCRQQQVDDGCFAGLADVPTRAVTLTVPRLLRCERIYCVVPGATKAAAVRATFEEPVSTQWPSTALRSHPHVSFFFDAEAAQEIAN